MKHVAPDLHRRQFLGSMTLTVGGAGLGNWLPASLLEAAPAACSVDACGDWQLDDICIAYPPYSLHMKAAVPAPSGSAAVFDPIDSHWVD
jgi:hypothetical protein